MAYREYRYRDTREAMVLHSAIWSSLSHLMGLLSRVSRIVSTALIKIIMGYDCNYDINPPIKIIAFPTFLRSKLQWSFKINPCIFVYENALQKVVCQMAAIVSRPQCANKAEPHVIHVMNDTTGSVGNIRSSWNLRNTSTTHLKLISHIRYRRFKLSQWTANHTFDF